MPEISLVVVSYETRRQLAETLRTVHGRGYEVVVVDNASSDGSADLVRGDYPDARLRALPDNLGFGSAANLGLEAATGGLCLVLNADARPRDGEAIPKLLACAAQRPGAGVIGPSLVSPDGTPQASLVGLPSRWWTGAPAVSGRAPGRLAGKLLRPRGGRGHFLVGAALLLRRDALGEVGGFDPAFFMFGEDVDLCRRMQEAGWTVERCPQATFVHDGGAATRADAAAMYREQLRGHLRLLAKHEGDRSATRARRYLIRVLGIRARLAVDAERTMYREAAGWLASADLKALLAERGQ